MASGVPVVASRIGGLPSGVEEGVAGHLAEVGDIDTMAEAGIDIARRTVAKYRDELQILPARLRHR